MTHSRGGLGRIWGTGITRMQPRGVRKLVGWEGQFRERQEEALGWKGQRVLLHQK